MCGWNTITTIVIVEPGQALCTEEVIEEPTEELKQALAELEDFEKHPEKYKSYDNVDEMFKDLDAEIANNGKNRNSH